MREIKFRAWDKLNKRLMTVNDIDFQKKIINFREKLTTQPFTFKDIKLMQFLGLQDIKGKDIYEGDIVKIHINTTVTELDRVGEIIFENGSFKIYYVVNGYSQRWLMSAKELLDVEIIGNIYENSELLEGER